MLWCLCTWNLQSVDCIWGTQMKCKIDCRSTAGSDCVGVFFFFLIHLDSFRLFGAFVVIIYLLSALDWFTLQLQWQRKILCELLPWKIVEKCKVHELLWKFHNAKWSKKKYEITPHKSFDSAMSQPGGAKMNAIFLSSWLHCAYFKPAELNGAQVCDLCCSCCRCLWPWLPDLFALRNTSQNYAN